MVDIAVWSHQFETGFDELDEQFKGLFQIINNLHYAVMDGRGKELVAETLDHLAYYVDTHLSSEEAWMQKMAYPDFWQHKQYHDQFRHDTQLLIEGFKEKKLVLSITVSQFLFKWLQSHTRNDDMKMIHYVRHHWEDIRLII